MVGKVAIKQALYFELGLSMKDIAIITGVSPRTAWNHVHAVPSAKVRKWTKRKPSERSNSVVAARNVCRNFLRHARYWNFEPQYFEALFRRNFIL